LTSRICPVKNALKLKEMTTANISSGHVKDVDDSSDDESASCFTDIGFMFDNAQSTKQTHLIFTPSCPCILETNSSLSVQVELECIDDNPGAVQSGHYLWPASSSLSQYIVDIYSTLHEVSCHFNDSQIIMPARSIQSMVELGAGCGLVSIVALQVFQEVKCSIMTDHDPGTLQRAKDNYIATRDSVGIENEKGKKEPAVYFENLEWGDVESAKNLLIHIQNDHTLPENESDEQFGDTLSFNKDGTNHNEFTITNNGFDLVLGSDLIYCRDVVYPLLLTASCLMGSNNSNTMFILSQSFPYDDDTEKEIDDVCAQLGLSRNILTCKLDVGGVRIQIISQK